MTANATLAASAGGIHEGAAVAVAVTLWLLLLGAGAAALLAAAVVARWQHRRVPTPLPPVTPLRTRRPTPEDLARLMAEVDALSIQALTAGMTAARAEVVAATARARCQVAAWSRQRAWDEYDEAHRAYVSALRTAAAGDEVWPAASTSGAWPVRTDGGAPPTGPARTPVPRPRTEPDPHGAVGSGPREQVVVPDPHDDGAGAVPEPRDGADAVPGPRDDVARAALAAYRRGGISLEQLRAILRHTSGWSQVHARHEREVLRRRASARDARRRYHAAAAAERDAQRAADVAAVAARAWADEACAAAEDASLARAFAAERGAAGRGSARRSGRAGRRAAAAVTASAG